jgi:hypothetical protein
MGKRENLMAEFYRVEPVIFLAIIADAVCSGAVQVAGLEGGYLGAGFKKN